MCCIVKAKDDPDPNSCEEIERLLTTEAQKWKKTAWGKNGTFAKKLSMDF